MKTGRLRAFAEAAGLLWLLAGCSVVNFSANYYAPPANYRQEVRTIFQGVLAQVRPKQAYELLIPDVEDSRRLKGIPAISERVVVLPDEFLKYVYQNYANDRVVIIGSIIVHEICHSEFDLPSSPLERHVDTDIAAIKVLGENTATALSYYRTLKVMHDYWFARKGMGGHAFNAGWNLANAASTVIVGQGYFRDWFATDVKLRMKLLKRKYRLRPGGGFKRSGI